MGRTHGSANGDTRGGGFDCAASNARSAHRSGHALELRSNNLGLRVTKGITP